MEAYPFCATPALVSVNSFAAGFCLGMKLITAEKRVGSTQTKAPAP